MRTSAVTGRGSTQEGARLVDSASLDMALSQAQPHQCRPPPRAAGRSRVTNFSPETREKKACKAWKGFGRARFTRLEPKRIRNRASLRRQKAQPLLHVFARGRVRLGQYRLAPASPTVGLSSTASQCCRTASRIMSSCTAKGDSEKKKSCAANLPMRLPACGDGLWHRWITSWPRLVGRARRDRRMHPMARRRPPTYSINVGVALSRGNRWY
jgi:hypothetical protein